MQHLVIGLNRENIESLLRGDVFTLPGGPVPVLTANKSDIVLVFAETDKDLALCFPPQYGSLLQGFAADEGDLADREWHPFPEGKSPGANCCIEILQ